MGCSVFCVSLANAIPPLTLPATTTARLTSRKATTILALFLGMPMYTQDLHSTSKEIIAACHAHILKTNPHNNDEPCDTLWLKQPSIFNGGDEELYLTISPLEIMGGIEVCNCIVHKVINGVHTTLSDLTSVASITSANAIAYIKCLSNFLSEKDCLPPENLIEDIIDHLDTEAASLILFGGEEGAGKTTTALELSDYVIDNKMYHSDNVLILNDQEDFSVLLENISIGRIRKPSLIIFDELHQSGDMFAVSTLLAANCSVVVVTTAKTFSGMIGEILDGIGDPHLETIIDEVKTYLVYMVLHTAGSKEGSAFNNYSTMTALNNRGLNLFDVMALNGDPANLKSVLA